MLRLNDYKCPKCGEVVERLARPSEDIKSLCCGEIMERLPSVFRINRGPVPITGYYDDNLESFVSTNRQRKELMRKRGVCEKGATPKPDGEAWV
jgi:hypothetical protein